LSTTSGELRTRRAVNCAGLHSDVVAELAGTHPPARILPFRGEYYETSNARRDLVRSLVYPVPDPAFPFLGVHMTRMTDGSLHVGPNAVPALAREGYDWRTWSRTHLARLVRDPALRALAKKYWRTGAGEIARSASKPLFVRAAQQLLPELRGRDLSRAGAGVRAQAVKSDGTLVDDFLVVEDEHWVHVLNAPSPAATASLLIGQDIAGRITALR
jgi:(S)-2-hydroxyglutarate dehydrogenase